MKTSSLLHFKSTVVLYRGKITQTALLSKYLTVCLIVFSDFARDCKILHRLGRQLTDIYTSQFKRFPFFIFLTCLEEFSFMSVAQHPTVSKGLAQRGVEKANCCVKSEFETLLGDLTNHFFQESSNMTKM